MKRIICGVALVAANLGVVPSTQALIIQMRDYEFNIDGVLSLPVMGDLVPAEVDDSQFNPATGLGTLSIGITGAGIHSVGLYVDLDMNASMNGYLDELGTSHGSPHAGLSWEIDDPGQLFGDILNHFEAGWLEDANAYGPSETGDIAMALDWNFTLGVQQSACLSFLFSETLPVSGFYLAQHDVGFMGQGGGTVYFSTSLETPGDPPGVPDAGSTWALMGIAWAILSSTRLLRRLSLTGHSSWRMHLATCSAHPLVSVRESDECDSLLS